MTRTAEDRSSSPPHWRAALLATPRPYSPAGLTGALLLACLSLTPSLLPREATFQGLIAGICAAMGYGLGRLVQGAARRATSWRPGPRSRRVAVAVLATAGPALLVVFLAAGARWQREIHRLMDVPFPGVSWPLVTAAVAVAVAMSLVATGRLLRRQVHLVSHRLPPRLPAALAGVTAVLIVGLVIAGLVNQVVWPTALSVVDQVFSVANRGTTPGVVRPSSPLRSGSPDSLSPWADLGVKGRDFVAGGPTVDDLERFDGRPAVEPIRVYVGLQTRTDAEERARLALAELVRTDAFDRAVLCVVTTTGTGWVNPQAAAALEYLHAGDTAIVATQYSYLPSPVSFLADRTRVEQEGRALFEAVHSHWSQLPPDDRPKLVVYGESLGSNGSQAPFTGLDDVRDRTDGALWVGPPNSNDLWRRLVARRDPDHPQGLPVHDAGSTVRFAAEADDLTRLDGPWLMPRVLFLQHPSDPVVWWSPELLTDRPDWLVEPRGDDISPALTMYPLVTFWQLSADLTVANTVPPGHGHRYEDLIPAAWAAIAPPPGDWTSDDTRRLQQMMIEQATDDAD